MNINKACTLPWRCNGYCDGRAMKVGSTAGRSLSRNDSAKSVTLIRYVAKQHNFVLTKWRQCSAAGRVSEQSKRSLDTYTGRSGDTSEVKMAKHPTLIDVSSPPTGSAGLVTGRRFVHLYALKKYKVIVKLTSVCLFLIETITKTR